MPVTFSPRPACLAGSDMLPVDTCDGGHREERGGQIYVKEHPVRRFRRRTLGGGMESPGTARRRLRRGRQE